MYSDAETSVIGDPNTVEEYMQDSSVVLAVVAH
jgi:hypothetical protein